jgi:hypothetical protein
MLAALADALRFGDDAAPWDGVTCGRAAESWRGADDDAEPLSADIPAADDYVTV